jgi:hypothetical protein
VTLLSSLLLLPPTKSEKNVHLSQDKSIQWEAEADLPKAMKSLTGLHVMMTSAALLLSVNWKASAVRLSCTRG